MLKKIVTRLEFQVIVSIGLAIWVGVFFPQFVPNVSWMGDIFMKLLKVFLAPLLLFSILTAVIGMGDLGKLGKIGVRTFAYYMLTTTFAITLSLLLMNIFHPGTGLNLSFDSYESQSLQSITFISFLLSLIPDNALQAIVELNAMQVVTIGIILGIFILKSASKENIKYFKVIVDTVNDAILSFIGFVIKLTPFGVFGIVSKVVAENGVESIINLLPFVLVVLLSLSIHAIIVLPTLGFLIGGFNPYKYMKKMTEPILLAFSTSSSSATMPVSMRVAKEKGKLTPEVVNFTFPIGATVNMDGTAIYQAGVAIFVAQVLGVGLDIIQQLTIVVIIIMASIGAAGVPGAGIIILAIVFSSIGLPVEAIGIILAVDRLVDMFRTAVNVWGDVLTAKVIDKYYKKQFNSKESSPGGKIFKKYSISYKNS